jgi:hypothetical protein
MTITITHLEGPLVGQEPQTFGDDVEEIPFGRSRKNNKNKVVLPSPDTIGREDIVLVRTGERSYEIRRRGPHYLEIDGQPIPKDQNNIQIVSGSVIRLGGRRGPNFRVHVHNGEAAPGETAETREQKRVPGIGERFTRLSRALAAGILGVSLALGALAWYQLRFVPARYRANIEHLKQNTYLVVERTTGGKPAATAFAIDDNRLATNAHVTEAIRKAPEKFAVKAHDGSEVKITNIETHPAYKPFQFKKWQIGRADANAGTFEHLSLQGAYDIGIITVKEPLSTDPLEVAPLAEILALRQGTELVSAGFPSENILSADNTAEGRPIPLHSSGEIRAVDDIFRLGDEKDERRQLVINTIPVAGGASGSPVIDAWTGKVIAVISGGNVLMVWDPTMKDSKRMSSAAMVNFAQRADLLDEMIKGTAADAMTAREAYWNEVASSTPYTSYGGFLRGQVIRYAKNNYAARNDPVVTELESGTLPSANRGYSAKRTVAFEAEPGFVYGILAELSGDLGTVRKTGIDIYKEGKRVKASRDEKLVNDAAIYWKADEMPAAWVRVSEPGKLEVKLNGFIDFPVDYRLFLYRWPAPEAVTAEPASSTQDPPAPAAVPQQ